MRRRNFIYTMGMGLGTFALQAAPSFGPNTDLKQADFKALITELLKTWADGMLAHQINDPDDLSIHGALSCPACGTIHGRCMDAVLPFLYLAETTGDDKYLKAGISVFEWSKNVSSDDGSWTVMPNPKSWKGISVFGAIALAETLKHHNHLLPENIKKAWKNRLIAVGEYIFKNFDLSFTNINYGFTAIYCLHLLGEVLGNETYTQRSHELAKGIKNWLTVPNKLIFGEAKPSNSLSQKGLQGVDLGYNVEETINGVVQYVLASNDKELIKLLVESLQGHLEFMFPDGAWDNSWGTRQYKWSYWGSRTTDGSQTAYTLLADHDPSFARAVFQNTLLLKACTADGLLHGGPYYVSHGVKPCIHHTFCHAKALATLLNENRNLELIRLGASLPIESNYGLKHFPEIDVWLFSLHSWRASISAYDFVYTSNAQAATGATIGLLYHQQIGPIFTASMAKYKAVEVYNQQTLPLEEDFALSPRIEYWHEQEWYTNLYDLKAKISAENQKKENVLKATVHLYNESYQILPINEDAFEITYQFEKNSFKITARNLGQKPIGTCQLVLPIVAKTSEKVVRINQYTLQIHKENGKLEIKANKPLQWKPNVFNLVPGIEAWPIIADFDINIRCTIKVL